MGDYKIKCEKCGYEFNTLSREVTHYCNYEPELETEYYPDPHDNNPPHLLKRWICDECYHKIGDIVKAELIENGNKYVADLNDRLDKVKAEYDKKVSELLEKNKEVKDIVSELEKLDNLSDMSTELKNRVETAYYSFSTYWLDPAYSTDMAQKQNKKSVFDWCIQYNIRIKRYSENVKSNDLISLGKFLDLVRNSVIEDISYKDLELLIDKIKLDLKSE